jgi:hypothetical protein
MHESQLNPAEGPSGPSDRVRLTRAAREATLRVPGVVATDTGPMGLYVTVAGGERAEGIICAASNRGGYDVSVRVIAGLVSLPDLSDQITAAITRAAARVGVSCSSVSVHFADLLAPGAA